MRHVIPLDRTSMHDVAVTGIRTRRSPRPEVEWARVDDDNPHRRKTNTRTVFTRPFTRSEPELLWPQVLDVAHTRPWFWARGQRREPRPTFAIPHETEKRRRDGQRAAGQHLRHRGQRKGLGRRGPQGSIYLYLRASPKPQASRFVIDSGSERENRRAMMNGSAGCTHIARGGLEAPFSASRVRDAAWGEPGIAFSS